MDLVISVLLSALACVSSIAGAVATRKEQSPRSRRHFFVLFIVLAMSTFGLTAWQAMRSDRGASESRKAQLGDPERPPFISIISLPGKTRFVRTNPSDFPAYVSSMKLFDATHRQTALHTYGAVELAGHTGLLDDELWNPEDDATEHRFTVEIGTRVGLFLEDLVLRRTANDQWMNAWRVRQGMRTLDQNADSAWPRDSRGQIDWGD